MRNIVRTAAATALAGAIALASATPTFARDWGRTAAAAGIGFAAGTIIGSSVANQNRYYYGQGYAYEPYYGRSYYGPAYTYGPAYGPAYAYESPAYAYEPRYRSPNYSSGYYRSPAAQMEQAEHTNPGQ